jgi:hypothetical protein
LKKSKQKSQTKKQIQSIQTETNPQSPQFQSTSPPLSQFSTSNEIELNSLSYNSYSFSTGRLDTDDILMSDLKQYVKYPMIYNEILRTISEQAYNLHGLYSNVCDYMVAIPFLSNITTMRNNTPELKEKKKKFNLMLKLLNHDRTTRDILRNLFIHGTYIGVLRNTTASNKNIDTGSVTIESIDRIEGLSLDDNFMIQPLDLDYCKIIGFQNNISIAGFDMMYFDQFNFGGLVNEIKNFPKDFLKAYMYYKKNPSKRWFTLDYRKTIALKFKAKEDEPYGRPLGLSAFCNMKASSDYDDSQYKLISELASSIYYLILPEGEKQGSCSLNKDQQTEVITAFKNAVKVNTSGDLAKISTLSLAPKTEIGRLSKDSSLLNDSLSNENMMRISTSLGFASSALNAESSGGSSYANLAVNLDLVSSQVFQCVNEIAREYTRVINELLGITPQNYIDIEYLPVSWLNKDDMFEKVSQLYTLIGGNRSYLVACAGLNVNSYFSCLDEEIEEGYEEKYPIHQSANTMSSKDVNDNKGGAPLKKEKDLSIGGKVTRNNNSNNQVKPSTK